MPDRTMSLRLVTHIFSNVLSRRSFCIAVFLAVAGGSAAGQTAGPNFDSLSGIVQPGDRVYLTDTTGREQQATIRALASALLQVEIDGAQHDFQPSLVRRVRVTRQDSTWNGVAIAAGIGATLGGLSSTLGECTPSPGCVVTGTLTTAGIAAAIGWLIDRSHEKRVIVYEAPNSRIGRR